MRKAATPPLQVMYGLRESLTVRRDEGLDNVFRRHYRIAEGIREADRAWDMELCDKGPSLYSASVSAVYVPDGFDSGELTKHAHDAYGVFVGMKRRI